MPTLRERVPVDLVKEMHAQCLSYSEIGWRLGISGSYLGEVMRKHGYAPGKDDSVRGFRRFPLQEAIRLYEQGLSTRQVAVQIKYTHSIVAKNLRKAGAQMRRAGGRTYDRVEKIHKQNFRVLDHAQIKHMYNVEKLSIDTIAKTFDVSWRGARWNLIEAGVKIRRRLRAPQ